MIRFKKVWRGATAAIMTGVLMVMSAMPALAATQFIGQTTSAVNVRTTPSTKSTKIGTLAKGDPVTIVAKVSKGNTISGTVADLNYYKLSTGGYVAAQYVKVTGSTEVEDSTETTTETTTGEEETETTDLSNLEDSDSSEDSDSEDSDSSSEQEGETVEGTDDSVALVEDDTTSTTVSTTSDTTETTTTTKEEVIDVSKLEAKKMQVKSGGLNVRLAPSTNAEVVEKLNGNDIVTVIRKYSEGDKYQDVTVTGSWYQLNTGGFVSTDYLEAARMTTSTTKKTPTTKTVTTKTATATTNATLYSSPNKLATQNGTLKKGSSSNITATYSDGSTYKSWKVSGTWYKLSNGSFVQAGSVKVGNSSKDVTTTSTTKVTTSIPAVEFFKPGDGIQMKKNVNMRKGPGTSFGVIRLLKSGETAVIEKVIPSGSTVNGSKVSGTWVKVAGEEGYIHGDYIEFDPEITVSYAAENGGVGGIGGSTTTTTTTTTDKTTTTAKTTSADPTPEELEAALKEE